MRQLANKKTSDGNIHTNPTHTDQDAMLADLLKIQQCTRYESPCVSSRKKSSSSPLSNRCGNQMVSTNQDNNQQANSIANNNCSENVVDKTKDKLEIQNDAMNRKTNESCFQDITNCSTIIKSGTLVLTIPQQCSTSSSKSSDSSRIVEYSGQNARAPERDQVRQRSPSTRCPVTVKIHNKAYDKYAIISQGQRRHNTSPPMCVHLRNVVVTQDWHRPTTFVVVTSGVEGRYLQFEASSEDAAQDWVNAFSTPKQQVRSPRHLGNWKMDASGSDKSELPATPSSYPANSGKENMNHLPVPQYTSFYEQTFPSPLHSPRATRSAMMPVLTESFEETDEDSDS